jgi:hypothetical protein
MDEDSIIGDKNEGSEFLLAIDSLHLPKTTCAGCGISVAGRITTAAFPLSANF